MKYKSRHAAIILLGCVLIIFKKFGFVKMQREIVAVVALLQLRNAKERVLEKVTKISQITWSFEVTKPKGELEFRMAYFSIHYDLY